MTSYWQISRRVVFWVLLLAALSAVAVAWQRRPQPKAAEGYRTETVDTGDIVRTITANGTLNPVVIVNVGTQVSGTIAKLYADFNQQVKAGQVLAELDPALVRAALQQSIANRNSAQADFRLTKINEARTRSLVQKGFVASAELDRTAQTSAAAAAKVKALNAQIERDQANLNYSVIRAPISGVVVARSVDVGQTVAASFQTPTLFQIAQDLKEMRIETSVAEADIGFLKEGQRVSFTVDAYAEQTFEGTIKQVRLNPTIQQNVVTYNAVVSAANPDAKLLPGMTAHVRAEAQRRNNVVRVPNAALRFKPKDADTNDRIVPGQTIHLIHGGTLSLVQIKPGLSDGTHTEVVNGALKAGDQVVVREAQNGKRDSSNFRIRMF
jgi:HlyD family secretion protein